MTTEILLTIGLTVIAVVAIRLGIALALCGGDTRRLSLARRVGLRILRDPACADQAEKLLAPAEPAAEKKPARPSAEPLWLLTLLQRDGRLLDFLLEDIDAYANEQIGAAVRDIHRNCHKALKEHVVLQPVLAGSEGQSVDVPAGFDPSTIRLTGNVTGQPPFRGTLQHHGWRVSELKLPPPPQGQDQFVVQPAEVELA